MLDIPAEQQAAYKQQARALKGSERRIFMARVVQLLGHGGQRYAEEVLGWNRRTIRKGQQELANGTPQIDQFARRGRKRVELHLPTLLDDLRAIIASQSQPGSDSASARLSAAKVRQRLIEEMGYADQSLPSTATLRKRLQAIRRGLPPGA